MATHAGMAKTVQSSDWGLEPATMKMSGAHHHNVMKTKLHLAELDFKNVSLMHVVSLDRELWAKQKVYNAGRHQQYIKH